MIDILINALIVIFALGSALTIHFGAIVPVSNWLIKKYKDFMLDYNKWSSHKDKNY